MSDDRIYLKYKQSRLDYPDPAMQGMTSGGLLGFDDELHGGLNSIAGAIQKGTLRDIRDDYKAGRDYARENKQKAIDKDKNTFTAWNTAAQIPSMALGGFGTQVGLGALSGLGNSDRTGSGLAGDVALGGGISAILNKAKVPGKLLQRAVRSTPIPQTIDTQAYLQALAKLAGEQS